MINVALKNKKQKKLNSNTDDIVRVNFIIYSIFFLVKTICIRKTKMDYLKRTNPIS